MRVADYIVSRIYNVCSDTIFSVSGRGALFLTDAVAKHKKIKNVACHHEQAAGFAAIAYSQSSKNERFGACLVSTGCASTNLITPVLSAWQDNLPCVFISGQNILKETSNYTGIGVRTYGQQEADIIPIVKSITKYSTMIHSSNDIISELEKALELAVNGRKGPVWLDIPLCIQSAIIEVDESELTKPILKNKKIECSQKDLSHLSKFLINSKNPVILIGSGVKSSGAEEELLNFLKSTNIPLVHAHSACDIIDSSYDFSIGSIGAMGASRAGNFTLQNSDCLIVIGNRLSSYTTGVDFCKFARNAKVFVVDIDKVEHSKESVRIDHFIHSDAKNFISKLYYELIDYSAPSNWVEQTKSWKKVFSHIEKDFTNSSKIDLYEFTSSLQKVLPNDYSLSTDSGFIEVIIPTNFNFKGFQQIVHPVSQGAMGFALAGAIGAYYSTKRPVVVIVGDGSIMMNIQELQTIRHNNLPIKIIVINNNVYGIIRRRQKDLFRRRLIGVDPETGVSCPDFQKVSHSYNLPYFKIDEKKHLDRSLKSFINDDLSPGLCEVYTREDQSYIEVASTKNQDGKYVRRPLEDQFPFIDRDVFLKQMLIDPIDQ